MSQSKKRKKNTSWVGSAIIVIFAIAIGFMIPVVIQPKMGYSRLMKNTAAEQVYSTNASTSVSFYGDLQFTEMSESVQEDLKNLRSHSGIVADDGLDARIDLMSLSANEWSGNYIHTKNISSSTVSSSEQGVSDIVQSLVGQNVSTSSEVLIEKDPKRAILRTDDGEWNDISNFITEEELKPLNTGDLVPILNFVADTVGEKNAKIEKTDDGYFVIFPFEISTAFLDRVPQEYREMLEKDMISWENVKTAVGVLEQNPEYHFPVTVSVHFTGKNQYRISAVIIRGALTMDYQKTYEDILAMLPEKQDVLDKLPDDYRFGIGGKIGVTLDYRCDIGYDPNIVISIDEGEEVVE